MTDDVELKLRVSSLEAQVRTLRILVRRVADAAGSESTDDIDVLDRLESDVRDLIKRLRDAPTS